MAKMILDFNQKEFEYAIKYCNEICEVLNKDDFSESEVYEELNTKGAHHYLNEFWAYEYQKTKENMGYGELKNNEIGFETNTILNALTRNRISKKCAVLRELIKIENKLINYIHLISPRHNFIYRKEMFAKQDGKWQFVGEEVLREHYTVYAETKQQEKVYNGLLKIIEVAQEYDVPLDIINYLTYTKPNDNYTYYIDGKRIKQQI